MQNAQTKRSFSGSSTAEIGSNGKNDIGKEHLENAKYMMNIEGSEGVSGHKSTVETKPNVGWQASHSNLAALHEKEQKYEAEHHHARHKLHRQVIPDYTSASTAMFSDCMFNTVPDRVRSLSMMKSAGLSPKQGFKGPFPQHSVALKAPDSGAGAKDQFSAFRVVQSQQHPAHRHYKHNDKNDFKSPSRSFVKDKKRLVHRFLKSMEPTTSTQSEESSVLAPPFNPVVYNTVPKASNRTVRKHSHTSDSSSQTNISLQSLLYHDLETSTKRHISASPFTKNTNPAIVTESTLDATDFKGPSSRDASTSSSSLPSSSSSCTSSTSSTSFSQSMTADPLELPGNNQYSSSSLSVNSDELDYYQHHIGLQLQQTEALLKHNLKDGVLKDEKDLTKNIANFDKTIKELGDLRSKTIAWKDLLEEDYLLNLQQDFDKKNPESFESRFTETIDTNVAKLQDLEHRMAFCKERLASRKETMRKMESLLSLENSLMISRKNVNFMSKYRNEVLDILSLIIIVILFYFFKHLIWH